MKSFKITIYLLFCLAFRLQAQDTISYSITTLKSAAQTLTQAADTANIATLRTALTNLKYLNRKGITSPTSVGILQSVNIDFLKIATRIDKGDTVEYILRLVQNGGLMVGIEAAIFLPKGSRVFVENTNGKSVMTLYYWNYPSLPDIFIHSQWNENKCKIHFVIPKSQESKAKMKIITLIFGFSQNQVDQAKKLQSLNQTGTSSDPYNCAYSTCFSDYNEWKMEAGSVL